MLQFVNSWPYYNDRNVRNFKGGIFVLEIYKV